MHRYIHTLYFINVKHELVVFSRSCSTTRVSYVKKKKKNPSQNPILEKRERNIVWSRLNWLLRFVLSCFCRCLRSTKRFQYCFFFLSLSFSLQHEVTTSVSFCTQYKMYVHCVRCCLRGGTTKTARCSAPLDGRRGARYGTENTTSQTEIKRSLYKIDTTYYIPTTRHLRTRI